MEWFITFYLFSLGLVFGYLASIVITVWFKDRYDFSIFMFRLCIVFCIAVIPVLNLMFLGAYVFDDHIKLP